MKANISNLIKALRISAKAHNVDCNIYDEDKEDIQVTLMGTSIPVVSDMEMICEAFYGTKRIVKCDRGWGFTTLFASWEDMLQDVDEELLALALPYGTRI